MNKSQMEFPCKVFFLIFLLHTTGYAQPVASSMQMVGDLEIYNDLKDESVYYYGPGNLELSSRANEKPDFQLLELRYTGSSAYGDNGDKRFMNVVHFGVSMKQASAGALREVKEYLGRSIDLRPLPVRDIDAFLVVPVGDASEKGAYKKLGRDGTFQAETSAGVSGKGGFWTERTFTLKLENHEAQLLWDQVAGGQLSMTLSYTFYADMVQGQKSDMKLSGEDKAPDELLVGKEELDSAYSVVVTQPVKSDAFPIRVDVSKWPDILKKLDINEGVPPGYAALEVRCFDFTNDLRPDLAVKGIDISAVGVGGRIVTIPTQKFLRSEPDLYAKQIRFPYAVKLTEPYQYRIVEYTSEGEKIVSPWQTVKEWSSHLDITTPTEQNTFIHREVDLELSLLEFKERNIARAHVQIEYSFGGKQQRQVVSYEVNESLPIKQLSLRCDRDRPVTYSVAWTFSDQSTKITESSYVPEDNYVYILMPEQ